MNQRGDITPNTTRHAAASGPLPPALRFLSPVAAAIYGKVIARRNAAFDRGKGVVEFDRPVISVGNLSVGGTGKTPAVRWLVDLLRPEGRRPCIAMRGYGARHGHSDEATLHTEAFPDVPVIAQPNRTEGLLDLFATEDGERIDTIVLDDGFQHRRIARCFDLVLIDARKDPFADHLLPRGWLREPPASLTRARGVLLTHAPDPKASHVRALRDRVLSIVQVPVACASHEWSGLTLHPGGVSPVSWLRGKRVVACSAIGSPDVFLSQVRAATTRDFEALTLRDHDAFNRQTVANLLRRAQGFDAVVVTAKDWTKLERTPAASWPCPVAVPQLALRFSGGEAELAEAILNAVDDYDANLRTEIEAERDADDEDDSEPTPR
jgi:tetraacyldisaccharide 4'-kinase